MGEVLLNNTSKGNLNPQSLFAGRSRSEGLMSRPELWHLLIVQSVLLVIAITIGCVLDTKHSNGLSFHGWAKVLGGAFAIGAICGSLELIFKHVKYFSCPDQQRHIVRILLMIPIYAMDSWASLLAPRAAEYINPVRDCYEAYVLYSFIKL